MRCFSFDPPDEGLVALDDIGDSARLAYPDAFLLRLQLDPAKGGWPEPASIWYPVPPKGYVSLGCVVERGFKPPDADHTNVRCVRTDITTPKTFAGKCAWKWAPRDMPGLSYCIWPIFNEVSDNTSFSINCRAALQYSYCTLLVFDGLTCWSSTKSAALTFIDHSLASVLGSLMVCSANFAASCK